MTSNDYRDLASEHAAYDFAELRDEVARYRLCYIEAIHMLAAREKHAAALERRATRLVEENRTLRRDGVQRLNAARDHYRCLQAECRRLREALRQQHEECHA